MKIKVWTLTIDNDDNVTPVTVHGSRQELMKELRSEFREDLQNVFHPEVSDEMILEFITMSPADGGLGIGVYIAEHIVDAQDPAHEQEGGYWAENPKYPVSDWQWHVNNGDTRQSYTEWIESEKDFEEDE